MTHGQREIAFIFCHLLGFELMPRIKRIGEKKQQLRKGRRKNPHGNIISEYPLTFVNVVAPMPGYSLPSSHLRQPQANQCRER